MSNRRKPITQACKTKTHGNENLSVIDSYLLYKIRMRIVLIVKTKRCFKTRSRRTCLNMIESLVLLFVLYVPKA